MRALDPCTHRPPGVEEYSLLCSGVVDIDIDIDVGLLSNRGQFTDRFPINEEVLAGLGSLIHDEAFLGHDAVALLDRVISVAGAVRWRWARWERRILPRLQRGQARLRVEIHHRSPLFSPKLR